MHFYPEGGDLAAGMENRVYFACQDPLGKPLRISGVIVDKNGRTVASVETISEGMGQFSFTPQAGESYRLKIITPADVKDEPKLPPVADCPIVLTTGAGVFGPSEVLEFNVRSLKAGLPLVVGAWSRGIMVGQVALVTKKSENGVNPIALSLPDEVGGIIRLTVFDYSIESGRSGKQFPKPLAERLVYRRPDRRLNVQALDIRDHYAPGEEVHISLAVGNEKNKPVAAAVGISVVDQALFTLAGDNTPTMTTRFLLTSENINPKDLEEADFYLSEDKTAAVPPAVALDLLLGAQGWRRFVDNTRARNAATVTENNLSTRPDDYSASATGSASAAQTSTSATGSASATRLFAPPIMYDNLSRIREDYQKKLAAYYADRSQVLYSVVTISFLGAWGMLFLIFMLGLLRIVRGAAFWLPVLGMVVCCSIIEALLINPLRFAGENDQAAPFMSYPASDERVPLAKPLPPEIQRVPLAQPALPGALPSLSPQLELVVPRAGAARGESPLTGPAEAEKPGHFVVRQYAHRHVAEGGAGGDFAESLFWNPLLIAGADGKVEVSFDLPDSIAKFRLQADASGAARLGSLRMDISTESPSEQETK